MLFTEMNQGFFVTPATTSYRALTETTSYPSIYAPFTTAHSDIKEEVTRLEASLDALNTENNPLFDTPRELLEHGRALLERYENIRDNKNMSFRDYLFYLHAYRISLTFARLGIAQTLALCMAVQMAATLASPIFVQSLFALSVAFLALRLLSNVYNAYNHAAFPSNEEADEALGMPSGYDRFIYELSLVKMQILNDIVWVSANLFTNYPAILSLSPFAVNGILLLCLTFDFVLSAYMYKQNELVYAEKTSEYREALAHMTPGDINIEVLSMQQKQLELNYLGKQAELQQFLEAGAVILTAFSLIASSALPFFLPLGAALCVFGTSLYLTAGKRGECIKAPSTENDDTYTNAFIKNTVYPLLFMVAVATLGWPVVLPLAATVAMLAPLPDPLKKLREDCIDSVSSLPKQFGFA